MLSTSTNDMFKCFIIFIILNSVHSKNSIERQNSLNVEDDAVDGNIQDYFVKFGNEDKYLNSSLLLRKYGYPVEEYFVVTEDGYNLTLLRVPGQGPAIFVMHGLISSSDDFITSGPHSALTCVLFDAGYDIWLGNARGNKYSTRHVRLSPWQKEFWQFSWHDIGYYDVPAMIDRALEISGRSQVIYVGHSQGTTVYYVLCSTRQEYNKNISMAFSLAPIAYIYHAFSPLLKIFAPFQKTEYAVTYRAGLYDFLPFKPFQFVTSVLCDLTNLAQWFCATLVFSVVGFNYEQIDLKQQSVQLSHMPAGSSTMQVTHYLQNADSKGFNKYDYGKEKNLKIYGSIHPPAYPLENITVANYIMYSTNDYFSSYDDVKLLVGRLSNVSDVSRVTDAKFNHFDYLWAKDVKKLVYLKMLSTINKNYKN